MPGLAVNRARQGTVGGEHKSDPRDARVIADQVRTRQDLRAIEPMSELDLELRLPVGRRRDLVAAQTQRLARLHDLLVGIFPGLEHTLDLTAKGPLVLLTKFATPAELRAAGKRRLTRHLKTAGRLPNVEVLAERALATAVGQTTVVPAERTTARLIKELAIEALACRTRLKALDGELTEILDRHPDAALIRSLPGMGVVLTAELIAEAGSLSRFRSADALAAAAGIAPVLRQSGKVRFLRRANGATRLLNASSTSQPSAPSAIPIAAPSTTESDAKGNATIKPSSLSQDDASTSFGPCSDTEQSSRQISNKLLDERIRLLVEDGELYVLVHSEGRQLKERGMRRRRLKKLWRRLAELQRQSNSRDQLMLKLGAAKKEAGRAWSLVDIRVPGSDKELAADGFSFRLRRDRLRRVRRREGRYLLRSNMVAEDPATLWRLYIQLTEIEQAFKDLKNDLAIRPIFHQREERIEAHIFVSFIAYCLLVTLKNLARPRANGLTPRAIIEALAAIQMVDVHLPTTDGRRLVLPRHTQPNKEHALLLHQLGMTLPQQPAPRICA